MLMSARVLSKYDHLFRCCVALYLQLKNITVGRISGPLHNLRLLI